MGMVMVTIMVLSAIIMIVPIAEPTISSDKTVSFDTRDEVSSGAFTQIPVQIFLKESSALSPKAAQANDADITQNCPDGFVHSGLFGFGVIWRFGKLTWKTVGTWKSEPLKSDLVIGGKMTYNLWLYRNPGTNQRTGTFKITLYNNDQAIGGTAIESGSRTITETPTQVSWEVQIGGNITPLKPGDVLGAKIECKIDGGCFMYYGGPNFNTGVTLTCNSLRIPGMNYDSESGALHVQVSEAFGISPTQLNPQLLIDDTTTTLGSEMGFNSVTFMREIIYYIMLLDSLSGGAHKATIVLTYSVAAAVNITQDLAFNYVKAKVSIIDTITGLFNTQVVFFIILFVILTVVLIVAIRVVKKSRKRKGMDGIVGKPGGFWDRRRKMKAAKKAEILRLKADKQRMKDLKKQAKLAKKK